ncbi:Obp46a [Drosophila busckii]|uniref:Obp46a n=1 Tax=Drosophila busckii TaxID=30019 RepID=A0A0M4ETK8_DROBS|nr:Obp46a [Drosophila busckii]
MFWLLLIAALMLGCQAEPAMDEDCELHASNTMCTAECTMNSTEYLAANRQSLNHNKVRAHLEMELADEADEKLLYETYVKCDKHALELLTHKGVQALAKRLEAHGCHVYPGLVMECVSNEMTLNCPPKRFHNDAACTTNRDYLKKCMHFLKYKA